MDYSNGLEAIIFKEETRTTLTMDLREISPMIIRISLRDQTSHMGTTIQITEDHIINAQTSHWIKTMKIDLQMDLSTIRMETGEAMEVFLVLHRLER